MTYTKAGGIPKFHKGDRMRILYVHPDDSHYDDAQSVIGEILVAEQDIFQWGDNAMCYGNVKGDRVTTMHAMQLELIP